MSDDLPTPRTTLCARYVCVHVWCKACRHSADADLDALVASGRGDVPLVRLRFRCGNCRGNMTEASHPRDARAHDDWISRLCCARVSDVVSAIVAL